MLTIKNMSNALLAAYSTLEGIATSKGQSIRTLSIDVNKSDITSGRIVGTVTVSNRSRRKFALTQNGLDTTATLLGVTRKVAA